MIRCVVVEAPLLWSKEIAIVSYQYELKVPPSSPLPPFPRAADA
jgi:hypothetical protein